MYELKIKNSKQVLFIILLSASLFNLSQSFGIAFESSTSRISDHKTVNKKQTTEIEKHTRYGYSKPEELMDKRQVRHSRFHRDHFSKKIFKTDETIPKKSDTSDATTNIKSRVAAHKQSPNESKSDKLLTPKVRVVHEPILFTDDTERTLARPGTTNRANLRDKHSKEYVSADEEDSEDEYDDSDDPFYDEDREDQISTLQHEDESRSQYDEITKQYMMADKWAEGDDEVDLFNGDPSHEEDYQDWEDSPQSDASSDPASDLKWERATLGHPRQNRKMKKNEAFAARQNFLAMKAEASCRTPKERVMSIQNVHPNPSKQYTPHCTILHRCGDDVGCCLSEAATCVPKNSQKLDLYFFVKVVGQERVDVEKLSFINHTECECVEKRTDYMVKDEVAYLTYRPGFALREVSDDGETETPLPFNKRCRCPTEYSVHMLDDGDCECDCFNKQRDCLRIKRGKEYFGLKDRICIQNGQCQVPNCEFGYYNSTAGRCPKKQERVEETTRHLRLFGK